MKLIFLDIDGVLNSQEWFKNRPKLPPTSTRDEFLNQMLDPGAIALFKRILKHTDAKVVISSTWRHYDDYLEIIKDRIVEYIDITGECECRIRGAEIRNWIEKNIDYKKQKDLKYAIIDDDSDMLLWQKDNFFRTSNDLGLTNVIAGKVIRHLNGE